MHNINLKLLLPKQFILSLASILFLSLHMQVYDPLVFSQLSSHRCVPSIHSLMSKIILENFSTIPAKLNALPVKQLLSFHPFTQVHVFGNEHS